MPDPIAAVYRYVCPDGRSYVGSTGNIRTRDKQGLKRSNLRLDEAFKTYPPETWTFEVLETLPSDCSKQKRLAAEQRHIERLCSWMPKHGFNLFPAGKGGNSHTILAAKDRFAASKAWVA